MSSIPIGERFTPSSPCLDNTQRDALSRYFRTNKEYQSIPPPWNQDSSPQSKNNPPLPPKIDTSFVAAVEGYNASLPCAINDPPRDTPVLTLWYIGSEEAPVYSYDQRSLSKPSSWADNTVMGSRAIFMPGEHPPVLLLVNVSKSDAKTYRCRVDYNYSNSRVAWVNLTVVVPASSLVIETHISPVEIGFVNDVSCKVFGGWPLAKVIWMQGGNVVDETFRREGNSSINTLNTPVSREDLQKYFTCTANNNDQTRPLTSIYQRNVTCGPLSVKIYSKDTNLVANRLTRFECVVIGSNPPPEISWFVNNEQIFRYIKTIAGGGQKTISKLDIDLKRKNHRNQLLCRAKNHQLPRESMEDVLTLNVAYKPLVNLSLGRSLDPSQLRESIDVFFECNIDANPYPYKVQWFHEGYPLVHNVSAGVVMSKNSVALQKVTRSRSGRYQCAASNVEGDSVSNNITIKIKYSPRCAVAPSLRGVALGELTTVECVVDADPDNVTFRWEFNNSVRKDTSETVSQQKFTQVGLKSILSYTPLSERDYGTLFCSAMNSVGQQKKPCSFTVISAGPPEQVKNCNFGNLTSHSVLVRCEEGFDGGLPQNFLLQIFEARTGDIVMNTTGVTPYFVSKPLEPGTTFHASVTSFNTRGHSGATLLEFKTLREATMHKILPSKVEPSPLVWVVGLIFGLALVVALLLLTVWVVKKHRPYNQNLHPQITTTVVMKENNNPDLITMEGSEEKLAEIGPATENMEEVPMDNTLHVSPALRQLQHSLTNSFQVANFPLYEEGDSPLFVSGSTNTNEKTRLTSPRGSRKDQGVQRTLQPRKQVIVRLHQDSGPESTF